MIVIGMTGPIGHGKSTFAKAAMEIEPTARRIESSIIIAEVANALHASTQKVPSKDDIEAINVWLRPLPSILLETVHTKCNFDQIKLSIEEINSHPIDYEKLLLHLENLSRKPDLLKHTINSDNKEEYRPILQWLGGYLVSKIDRGIWYKEITRRIYQLNSQGVKLCLVGGLRFPSDAQYIHDVKGIIIKVYRPGHLQYDMLDPTERERENVTPDATVISNGSVEDIKACAKRVLTDIADSRLQKTYYAKI